MSLSDCHQCHCPYLPVHTPLEGNISGQVVHTFVGLSVPFCTWLQAQTFRQSQHKSCCPEPSIHLCLAEAQSVVPSQPVTPKAVPKCTLKCGKVPRFCRVNFKENPGKQSLNTKIQRMQRMQLSCLKKNGMTPECCTRIRKGAVQRGPHEFFVQSQMLGTDWRSIWIQCQAQCQAPEGALKEEDTLRRKRREAATKHQRAEIPPTIYCVTVVR